MPAKSHVDLCMFVQILEVSEDKIPSELIPVLLSRDYRAIQTAFNSSRPGSGFSRDLFVDPETNLHESVHVIQAVIYPFLRWYAMVIFQQVVDLFKELGDLTEFANTGVIDSYHIPSFSVLEVEHYIWEANKKFLFWNYRRELGVSFNQEEGPQHGGTPLVRLNAVDLIENAASLIQYKFSTGKDFPTWKEFSRWSKRNKSYTRVSEFLRAYLQDDDLSVRILCPMIQVAFETNKPVRAFATLLAALKVNLEKGNLKGFVDRPEPCRWIELFDVYMKKIRFDDAEYGDVLSEKFFRLDRYVTSNMRIGGQLGHPIIGYFSKLWGELEQEDLAYRYAFTAPNGYVKQIKKVSEIFKAPITLLKFSIRGENIVLVAGDLDRMGLAIVDAPLNDSDMRSFFVDFMVMFGLVRRFGNALMDPDFRLCHHSDCPFYQKNFCNTWIFVPADYEKCGFSERVKYVRSTFKSSSSSHSRIQFKLGDGQI